MIAASNFGAKLKSRVLKIPKAESMQLCECNAQLWMRTAVWCLSRKRNVFEIVGLIFVNNDKCTNGTTVLHGPFHSTTTDPIAPRLQPTLI